MSSYIFIELEDNNLIGVNFGNGVNVGPSLVTFLTTLSALDTFETESIERQWFDSLLDESKTNIPLLGKIIYSGDWNYGQDDYQKFLDTWKGYGLANIKEEQFQDTLTNINNMWTPIQELVEIVKELTSLFDKLKKDYYWYSHEGTPFAFSVVSSVLQQLLEQGIDRIRFKID